MTLTERRLTARRTTALVILCAWATLASGSAAARPAIVINFADLQGAWTWFTDPNQQNHRWGGSVVINEIRPDGSFTGNQTGQDSTITGKFTGSTVTWSRDVGAPDSSGSNTQTWSGHLTYQVEPGGKVKVTISGHWSGAFQTDSGATPSDLEFNVVKEYEGSPPS